MRVLNNLKIAFHSKKCLKRNVLTQQTYLDAKWVRVVPFYHL